MPPQDAWSHRRPPPVHHAAALRVVGKYATARLTSTQFAEWRYCKVKISDATRQVPATLPRGKWETVWKALMNAAVDVNVGALGTEAGQLAEWIGSYLHCQRVLDDREAAIARRMPYWDGDDVCVFATALLNYLREVPKERIDAKQLALLMRAAGAAPEKIGTRPDNRDSTTNIYRLPPPLHGVDPSDR